MDDIILSKYNSGYLQTNRLDKIMTHLNFSKNNPLAYDSELQEYNYKLWFREICNLMDEFGSLFNNEELKSCIKMRNIIDDFIDEFDIYSRSNKKIDTAAWKKIKKALQIFEREIKRLGYKYSAIAAFKEQAGRI